MNRGHHSAPLPRQMSFLAVFCVLALLIHQARPGADAGQSSDDAGLTVVEVRAPGHPGSLVLFRGPADGCLALQLAGMVASCPSPLPVVPGEAVFVMPDKSVVVGSMSGQMLVLFGLPVPVNLAGAGDLQAIDGIGPARASAIVSDRIRKGPFRKPDDLDRVRGIGKKTAAAIGASMSFEAGSGSVNKPF